MSHVTSLVFVYSTIDKSIMSALEIADDTEEQRFVDVTKSANEAAIGPYRKMLQLRLAATAVNYLKFDQLVERISTASWKAPESVLLLVKDEHYVRPAVWGFAGARYFGSVDEPRSFVCLIEAVPS